ncbi:TTLL9 polyglutamylase, partial [Balaeniceps rex]|nr:TTLL9 polyglutamylase [Balaeniceps rex]
QLSQKNCLVKNLKRFQKQLEAGKLEATKCAFIPKTFKMPSEYYLFLEEFRKNPGIAWILKPVSMCSPKESETEMNGRLRSAEGEGNVQEIPRKNWAQQGGWEQQCSWPVFWSTRTTKTLLVQQFISAVQRQLITPFPFSQYIPLKAWLYRGGFARFSNTRFTPTGRVDGCVLCVSHKEGQEKESWLCWDVSGLQVVIQQLGQHLAATRGAGWVEVLLVDTDNAFIHSLQSVRKVTISDKHCFELYGYDILIRPDLRPWLLEVNASPSLAASSQEDCELECHLLKDTLHTVDRAGRQAKMLTGKEKRVGGFDLLWNDGPVSRGGDLSTPANENITAHTHLGCYDDGEKQLKQLFRNLPA